MLPVTSYSMGGQAPACLPSVWVFSRCLWCKQGTIKATFIRDRTRTNILFRTEQDRISFCLHRTNLKQIKMDPKLDLLGHVYTGLVPFGSGPKIRSGAGLLFTWDRSGTGPKRIQMDPKLDLLFYRSNSLDLISKGYLFSVAVLFC